MTVRTIKKDNPQTREKNDFLHRIKSAIHELLPDAEVVLYGSRARGDAAGDSDWDFLILTDQEVNSSIEEAIWDRLYLIGVGTNEVISAVVKNRRKWSTPRAEASPYHQNVTREGIVI